MNNFGRNFLVKEVYVRGYENITKKLKENFIPSQIADFLDAYSPGSFELSCDHYIDKREHLFVVFRRNIESPNEKYFSTIRILKN